MVHSTGPSETDSQQQMMMRQKRKPDDPGAVENEEHHHTSLHLYHLTLSKLLSSPTRRIGEILYNRGSLCCLGIPFYSHRVDSLPQQSKEKNGDW